MRRRDRTVSAERGTFVPTQFSERSCLRALCRWGRLPPRGGALLFKRRHFDTSGPRSGQLGCADALADSSLQCRFPAPLCSATRPFLTPSLPPGLRSRGRRLPFPPPRAVEGVGEPTAARIVGAQSSNRSRAPAGWSCRSEQPIPPSLAYPSFGTRGTRLRAYGQADRLQNQSCKVLTASIK